MSTSAIIVFTRKSKGEIISAGGSSSWKLDRKRALNAEYVVCCRNAFHERGREPEPNGQAFLIGKVSGVVPAPNRADGRWLVQFSVIADLEIPELWPKTRNPVHYTTLEEIGIESSEQQWQEIPQAHIDDALNHENFEEPTKGNGGLSIAEAKAQLAKFYGVKQSAIEVIIRG